MDAGDDSASIRLRDSRFDDSTSPQHCSASRPASPPTAAASRDFIALLKPRVMSLVVFTGFAGLAVAPGHLHPLLGAVAVLCIAVGAGASGAINMWYDRDIDAVMARTAAGRSRAARSSRARRSASASCSPSSRSC